MVGKFVYALFLVASIAAVSNAAPDDNRPSHDLIVGGRNPYDRLIVDEPIVKKSSVLQIVKVTKTFYALNERQRITEVKALDQKTNGKGAYASLVAGGPGQNFVTLTFKSQRGHGINFRVQVYAE